MFKRNLTLLALVVGFAIPCTSQAVITQASSDMQVKLSVLKACTITASDIDFGQVTSNAGAQEQKSDSGVTCTRGTTYSIAASSANGFKMKNVSDKSSPTEIPYNLSGALPSGTAVNISSSQGKISGTGTGTQQSVTITGDVTADALSNATEGDYADTVTLTVNY